MNKILGAFCCRRAPLKACRDHPPPCHVIHRSKLQGSPGPPPHGPKIPPHLHRPIFARIPRTHPLPPEFTPSPTRMPMGFPERDSHAH